MILGKGHLTPLALAILMSSAPVAAAPAFDPATIWTGGLAGLWLDPSTISTGFQVSTGLTAQTATGQPTGLRLDRRLGLALGAQLCTDTGFDNAASWTIGANWAVSGSKATATGSTGTFLYQTIAAVTAGKYIEMTVTVSNYSAGNVKFFSGNSATSLSPAMAANGTYTYRVATAGSGQIGVLGSSGFAGELDNISFKEVTGNHVLQGSASPRPEYDLISGIASDYFDGLDDGYSTATFAAGTLTSSMDLFIVLKRASASNMVIASQAPSDGSRILGVMDGSAGGAFAGVGASFAVFVDGAAVGSVGSCTRLQLSSALPTGAYHVLEIRNLDLSLWTQFTVGLYGAYMLNADVAGAILSPAQSTGNRNSIRTYLGAKAGLTL